MPKGREPSSVTFSAGIDKFEVGSRKVKFLEKWGGWRWKLGEGILLRKWGRRRKLGEKWEEVGREVGGWPKNDGFFLLISHFFPDLPAQLPFQNIVELFCLLLIFSPTCLRNFPSKILMTFFSSAIFPVMMLNFNFFPF
jgi:hypothetical protein